MNTLTSTDGTKLAYDRVGEGPPLVLVAGAFGFRNYPSMLELVDLLSRHFTVFNYDRRARGDSADCDPYASTWPDAVEREIADLHALIDEAGGSAHAWGYSSGAVLAMRAATRGAGIERLALYEPPFIVDREDYVPPKDFKERLHALILAENRSDAARHYMRRGIGIPAPVVTVLRLLPSWKRAKALAPSLAYDWALLDGNMSGDALRTQDWAAIAAPTLVISGTKSQTRLRHGARAAAEAIPGARYSDLQGQRHNVSMKVLAPVLVDFFSDR